MANSPYPQPAQPNPVMVLSGRLDAADIPALCDRVRELLEPSGRFTMHCDVDSLVADATTINALARMALTCRRLGHRLELRGASGRLEELLVFAGLIEVLPCLPDGGDERSGVKMKRQAKQRKEARRVEEERDPCDPIV